MTIRRILKYLVTICKPQKKEYVDPDDITRIIKHLETNGIVCEYGKLERHGMYRQLHFHGLFLIHPNIFYSNFTRINGYRVYYKRMKRGTELVVMRYIDKYHNANNTQQDVIFANYYRHHYGF